MKSRTTERFRKCFSLLPKTVQRQARRRYHTFKENPNHPSLRFKRIHGSLPIYSVRVSTDYRALGALDGEEMIWFWIGTHADYDKVLAQMKS